MYVDTQCKNGCTPLHAANVGKHLEVVSLFLDHGADVNAQRRDLWTALHREVHSGHIQVVEVLLERGADPQLQTNLGVTPIQLANPSPSWVSKEDRAQIIRLLSECTSEKM